MLPSLREQLAHPDVETAARQVVTEAVGGEMLLPQRAGALVAGGTVQRPVGLTLVSLRVLRYGG